VVDRTDAGNPPSYPLCDLVLTPDRGDADMRSVNARFDRDFGKGLMLQSLAWDHPRLPSGIDC